MGISFVCFPFGIWRLKSRVQRKSSIGIKFRSRTRQQACAVTIRLGTRSSWSYRASTPWTRSHFCFCPSSAARPWSQIRAVVPSSVNFSFSSCNKDNSVSPSMTCDWALILLSQIKLVLEQYVQLIFNH